MLDGFENEEEEYDALNDETFGASECSALDDWEEQHEQLSGIEESNRKEVNMDQIMNFVGKIF